MRNHSTLKIFLLILFMALVILVTHFHLDGLIAKHDDCPLCQLLAAGFTGSVQIILLLISWFIIELSPIDLRFIPLSSYLQIALRAPPYHSQLSSL